MKLKNLLESPETCMWNLRQFGEVTILTEKCPKRLENHFLKVPNSWTYRIYWNHLKNMQNLRQFGEVTIFDRKMPTAPDLRKRMKLWHFLKVLQNSWNLQNLSELLPETCIWNFRLFGEVTIFDSKMPTAPDLRKKMKLWHFLKVLQNSWNLQNLLESPPETCMWNLRQFGEVTFFDRKMLTATDLRKRWNYDIFSKFSKIQNYRIYWKLQKHAQKFTEKCPKRRMKKDEIMTFSQSSPKFMKLTEFIGITSRNMHVKFEAVWRSYNFWQKNAQRRPLEKRWNYDIFSKFSKIHETYRIYWNHLQAWNLRLFGEVTIFDRKMPKAPDLRKRMK